MKKNKNINKVTVVTVTYNAEEVLEETILSVINQSYENIEYIIIDGASTDGTIDIIKKYENRIDYWISKTDDGIYYAMNKAIEKATGEWINFMNAGDTFLDLDTVAYVMEHRNINSELIYGDYKVKDTGTIIKAKEKSQWLQYMPFCHQTLFTRSAIMKEELFDTSYQLAADHNFIIKMYLSKKKFQYIDKSIAIFLPGGFADSNKLLMYIESIKVFLDNKVSQEEIEQSRWYINLQKKLSQKEKEHVNKQAKWIKKQEKVIERKTNELEKLQFILQELASISFFNYPIEKIKKYKQLMKEYHKLKRNK